MPLELMLQNQIEAYLSAESLRILVSTVEFNTPYRHFSGCLCISGNLLANAMVSHEKQCHGRDD